VPLSDNHRSQHIVDFQRYAMPVLFISRSILYHLIQSLVKVVNQPFYPSAYIFFKYFLYFFLYICYPRRYPYFIDNLV